MTTETRTSPDGRLEAIFQLTEMAHGQWVETPSLRDLRSGAMVVALTDWWIDGSVVWGDKAGCFTLMLRRWPDPSDGLIVHCDVDGGTVRLGDAEAGEPRPLAEAAALIARHFEARAAAAAAARPAEPAPQPSLLRRLRDSGEWIAFALFILFGLALAMDWVS